MYSHFTRHKAALVLKRPCGFLYYLRKREKKRASATQWQMVTVLLTDAGMSNTPAFSNAPIKGTVVGRCGGG